METREAITQLVFLSQRPKSVDIVLVLGCDLIASMDPAIDLYRKGLTKKIVISGRGPTHRRNPEWQIYHQYALSQGIPNASILIESEARNTHENFVFSEVLISREIGWNNVTSIAIVTAPVHARRARMTAIRNFPAHVELTMLSPLDEKSIQADTWWNSRLGRQLVLEELRRIGEYGIKGHLADF